MKSFLCILFGVLCLSLAPKKKDIYEIKFGSGGGITGLYTYYLLKQNSELYVQQGASNVFLKRIRNTKTNHLFKTISSSKLLNMRYNKPGNYTNQIFIIKNQVIVNQIQWSQNDTLVPSEILNLYHSLYKLLK